MPVSGAGVIKTELRKSFKRLRKVLTKNFKVYISK